MTRKTLERMIALREDRDDWRQCTYLLSWISVCFFITILILLSERF